MKHTAFLLLMLVCLSASAQDRGLRSEGREFYLGYLHPSFQTVAKQIQLRVYALVGSHEDNEIAVSYFNASGVEMAADVYYVKARRSIQIELDVLRMLPDSIGDRVQSISCHITAKRPASIQYYSLGPNSGGSYLALPISSWGRKYVIAAYNDNPGYGTLMNAAITKPDLSSGVFTVIAAYGNTNVTITPTAQTMGGHIGVNQGPGSNGTPQPYTVKLGKGQCYFVRSASSGKLNEDDISATIISADKPIAVISGHEDAIVGDGSVPDDIKLDHRDFMIDQLIPYEFWEHDGYISIPYKETEGVIVNGVGENFRVYVADTLVPPSVTVQTSPSGSTSQLYPQPYARPSELQNRAAPMSFSSAQEKDKFSVVQYDLRAQGSNGPFPTPSMSSLVPISQWSTSYAWYVPRHPRYAGQAPFEEFFVTCIGNASTFESIMVSIDGTTPRPIGNVLKLTERIWNKSTIPGYPDLKAVVYKISVGVSFHATSPSPFMMYAFGDRATDFGGDLGGPFDGDDYMFSYANPLGMSLFDRSVSNKLTIDIDTLCTGGWKICATDSNINGGIRFVSLVDDPHGNLFAGKNYQHTNVSILPPDDPLRLGEIALAGDEKSYCFSIGVNDPGKDAYAPVIIYDKAGNYRILELRQSPQKLTISPDPFTNPKLFSGTKLGVKVCTTFTVRNEKTNPTSYPIETLSLSTSQFSIEAVNPKLPATIMPGDSLLFDVCFEASDTLLHRDTIHITGSCLDLRLPLSASTVRPGIVAADALFGKVLVGKTVCKAVTISNPGDANLVITGGTIIQTGSHFSLDPSTSFPITVLPGASAQVKVCYTPDTVASDDAWISWETNVTPPFTSEHKPITNLAGEGFKEPVSVGKSQQAEMKIYPNPAADNVVLELTNVGSPEISVTISDVLGNELIARTYSCEPSGVESFTISCAQLANGHYIVRIVVGGEVHSKNLTIQR